MAGWYLVLDAIGVRDNDEVCMSHNKKRALIFGITGQDGSYASELLLSKGYEVHGLTRRVSIDNRARLKSVLNDINLHEGDTSDAGSLWRVIAELKPDEIYNLAAQTHVHTSFAEPEHTGDVNALGVTRILEAIRTLTPQARFYQASTSELFGQGGENLNETSPMHPASPYGAAKLYAFHMVRIYREAYGLFACNGILFNHESPRRGANFVTSKIGHFAKQLRDGTWNNEPLLLGNLDAKRDWGHARDYVDGMWRMLQAEKPDDYVLATGIAHTVRDCVNVAIPGLTWSGTGAGETGKDAQGRVIVRIDPSLYRPIDVPVLTGDATKAKTRLGWSPQTGFEKLIGEMIA